ncbi:hypothetical protein M2105_002942 [Paenibacillus sp. PastF-1]|nr:MULTISPECIES: hypothetical protein [unclassified Paenibacillus]MDF9848394.1 hypothetical protein [Paenibacillus sp. PastM-2]MDF9855085.1 hypothetical protein [Paenibacillus sp. PastF-1]MDH6480354.1 hypothetical protein [Paenibacillus sp. PastH-2]MDH6507662.1 hypothetical protein [Paenibacillus sp. PastM-3]
MEEMGESDNIPYVKNVNSEISSSIEVIGLDFYETKIRKLKEDIAADKRLSLGLRIFFIVIVLIGLADILTLVNWITNYVSVPITIFSALMVAASFGRQSRQVSIQAEIDALERQKNRLESKATQSTIGNFGNVAKNNTNLYFDTLVGINLRNLEDYYELVKVSNRKSFNASLAVSILGFLLIAGGLVASYIMDGAKDMAYIAGASGVMVEIVSGLMFYLYSKTILQLKEYHDSLLNVQNMLLSFKLFEDHKDSTENTEILKQMIEYLLITKPRL